MTDEDHTRLKEALKNFEGVDVFIVMQSGSDLLVRYDGAAQDSHVFAELNAQRLTPKGIGLRVFKQSGLTNP